MKSLLGRGMALLAVPLAMAFVALPAASAASSVNLGGDAYYNSTGVVLTSSTSLPNGYSYLYVNEPAGTTLSDITNLSADFQMLQGDCGAVHHDSVWTLPTVRASSCISGLIRSTPDAAPIASRLET